MLARTLRLEHSVTRYYLTLWVFYCFRMVTVFAFLLLKCFLYWLPRASCACFRGCSLVVSCPPTVITSVNIQEDTSSN